MKNAEKEELIFEFWNTFKGQQTSTKRCSKTGSLICWRSHNKLTYDMRLAIRENLKNYSVEDMCMAIDNYAEILFSDHTFWTHVWPLSTFFAVKYTNAKDARKKWWQWLPENYDIRTFLKRNGNTQGEQIEDSNPELTNMITKAIQKWDLVKKGFIPNIKQTNQLISTAQKMKEFYKGRSCQDQKIWLGDLYDCLNDNYLGKHQTVAIGTLCSDYVWNILMPQLLRTCGNM